MFRQAIRGSVRRIILGRRPPSIFETKEQAKFIGIHLSKNNECAAKGLKEPPQR